MLNSMRKYILLSLLSDLPRSVTNSFLQKVNRVSGADLRRVPSTHQQLGDSASTWQAGENITGNRRES